MLCWWIPNGVNGWVKWIKRVLLSIFDSASSVVVGRETGRIEGGGQMYQVHLGFKLTYVSIL